MEPDPPQEPINYRNAADDRPEARSHIGAFIGGAVTGVLVVAFAGFCGFLAMFQESPSSPRKGISPLSLAFGIAAIIGFVFGFKLLIPPRRRYFWSGFLLFMAVASLVEGTCFFNS